MDEIKFMDMVVINEVSGCWLWVAHIASKNSTSRFGWKSCLAHRWSYEHFVGAIPTELEVDHLCGVRSCVNPDHMELVKHKVNCERGSQATKTHCVNGHERDYVNTYIKPNGTKRCRICNSIAACKYQKRGFE